MSIKFRRIITAKNLLAVRNNTPTLPLVSVPKLQSREELVQPTTPIEEQMSDEYLASLMKPPTHPSTP